MCFSRLSGALNRLFNFQKCVILERKRRSAAGDVDVRIFFRPETIAKGILETVAPPGTKGDGLAERCLNWVVGNIQQRAESEDYWQFPMETFMARSGDCEDGSILLANLMVACGLPSEKVYLAVLKLPQGFHMIVVYDWQAVLDWTGLCSGKNWTACKPLIWYVWNQHRIYVPRDRVKELEDSSRIE